MTEKEHYPLNELVKETLEEHDKHCGCGNSANSVGKEGDVGRASIPAGSDVGSLASAPKSESPEKCSHCNKNSETPNGFHLKNNLNFCGNLCIAEWVELFYSDFLAHEKRIKALEKEFQTSQEFVDVGCRHDKFKKYKGSWKCIGCGIEIGNKISIKYFVEQIRQQAKKETAKEIFSEIENDVLDFDAVDQNILNAWNDLKKKYGITGVDA